MNLLRTGELLAGWPTASQPLGVWSAVIHARTRDDPSCLNLGGVESLIEHPAIMTHASVPPDRRAELGIADGFIRLSVGIEDLRDLQADLDRAFRAAK